MVAAQQNNDEQVRQTIDKCIARTMRAEVVVQKRRDQAPVAARKAVATRTQREEARNIKQFEKLKQSLQEQGVVSPDGAVINKNRKPQKTKKR